MRWKLLLRLALTAVALSGTSSVYADLTGKVVGVADGDTITELRDHAQIKIRLVGIWRNRHA